MSQNSNKFFLFGNFLISAILIISGISTWYLYFKEYRQVDTVQISQFPKSIGIWTSEEMTLTEDEYAILETRNIVARKYSAPNHQSIYLLLVYSQHNRKVSHPPEVCYTGSGISILGSVRDFLKINGRKTIHFNRLLLELNGSRQLTAYWFKVGDSYTPNYWKQQLLIASKTLLGKPHSSALIRISADVVDGDELEAINRIKNFTQIISESISNYLP